MSQATRGSDIASQIKVRFDGVCAHCERSLDDERDALVGEAEAGEEKA